MTGFRHSPSRIGFSPPSCSRTSSAQPSRRRRRRPAVGSDAGGPPRGGATSARAVSRKEIDTAGDGFFVAFDGPARGIRCAVAIRDAVRSLGLEIRAGLHTGECEKVGDKLTGIAVNVGARVGALAGSGEVLVSSTVVDLVAGSGLVFEDRGEHELKGVPGPRRLFAVAA